MEAHLSPIEARILGCLIEKEMATPDYYPLTLNALVNACNQKTNRDPVMEIGEAEATAALDRMREMGIAMRVHRQGDLAQKYQHAVREKWLLEDAELALLCELLVRGPQTAGELKGRASRLHELVDRDQVEALLEQMAGRPRPCVVRLPRQPGRKESRWAQRLTGPAAEGSTAVAPAEAHPPAVEGAPPAASYLEARIAALEGEVAVLRKALADFGLKLG